jgi:GAF domain-containing protein
MLHEIDLPGTIERLSASETVDGIAKVLRESARRLTGAHGVALILRDGDFCHYVDEDAIGPLWKGQRFPMAACISGWAMLKRQTVRIPDISVDRRIPRNLYEDTFVQSLVMTPIGREPPVGALGAYWGHIYAAPAQEVNIIEALAEAASVAIKRAGNPAVASQV